VTGIPGSPFSYASYGYVPWLRRRFSTRSLWVLGHHNTVPMTILIFFFGIIKGKDNRRLFLKLGPMMAVYTIQTTIDMVFYGAKKVIPEEIRNECIDYGEWKNGFRAEAMSGALRAIPAKIAGTISGSFSNFIMGRIGFKTGASYNYQRDSVALGVFALSTIVPATMSIIGIIPKFFYNISQSDREQMYAELKERRAATSQHMTFESEIE
jgi:GPH family glycoside/pentoside/hexuronide:cation symporter/probable glucitol transport protein GutA